MTINFTKIISALSVIISSYGYAQVTESFDTFTLSPKMEVDASTTLMAIALVTRGFLNSR